MDSLPNSADRWNSNSFELAIEDISELMESPVSRRTLRIPKPERIEQADLIRAKEHGVYLPGSDRECLGRFDLINDCLPQVACISAPAVGSGRRTMAFHTRQIAAVPKLVSAPPKDSIGIYAGTVLLPNRNKVEGWRLWYWIDKNGAAHILDAPRIREVLDQSCEAELDHLISTTLQLEADRRFCWSITADERGRRITLGCTSNEVKSLLYARNLPLTVTGRKRPILHLVAAHRRRTKNGTDINIDDFVRGVRTVDMDGTRFTVAEPRVLRIIRA